MFKRKIINTVETMEGIPQKYMDFVGTRKEFSGGLFSSKKAIDPAEFDVLDVRWGSAKIMNTKTMEMKHPTVEFLVKNESMKQSRWTRPFPVPEIKLKSGIQ